MSVSVSVSVSSSFKAERERQREAERRRETKRKREKKREGDRERTVVNVRPHSCDHGRQPGRLGQVGNDLPPLHAGVVVLINKQRLDDHEDLMHEGPNQIVQLIEHPVDDLDKEVSLLVLKGRGHEEGQDLVEEGPGAEVAGLVREGPQRGLAHGRRAVLHLLGAQQ